MRTNAHGHLQKCMHDDDNSTNEKQAQEDCHLQGPCQWPQWSSAGQQKNKQKFQNKNKTTSKLWQKQIQQLPDKDLCLSTCLLKLVHVVTTK